MFPHLTPTQKRLAIILFLLGVFVVAYDWAGGIMWVGFFPLEVQLEPREGREIVAVSVDTLGSREWAEELRQDIRRADLDLEPVEAFNGKTFVARVHCCGSSSGWGRELSYGEDQLLVLRLDFADGNSRFEVVEIPPGRGRRRVVVEVPIDE